MLTGVSRLGTGEGAGLGTALGVALGGAELGAELGAKFLLSGGPVKDSASPPPPNLCRLKIRIGLKAL